jgi:integrase
MKKEAKCEVCKKVLEGVETWCSRLHVCGSKTCQETFATWQWQYVGPKQRKCDWERCDAFVPEGYFRITAERITCSKLCYTRIGWFTKEAICAECGKAFKSKKRGGSKFCCIEHMAAYMARQSTERAGVFAPDLKTYLEFSSHRLSGSSLVSVKVGLVSFFEHLQRRGITDLASVNAKVISEWIAWGLKNRRNLHRYVHAVSVFMQWLISIGRRKDNPVTRFHRAKSPKRLPRPYTEHEMALAWRYLEERGSTQAKVAVALAEESGARIGEIANARLSDLDLVGRRLFIRLPNKTMTERWVPFHDKSQSLLKLWLTERDKNLGHDHLLHTRAGKPYKNDSLHYEIANAVCKTVVHRKKNEEGFDTWSTHRLRHTMATRLVRNGANAATVMAIGGWVTAQAMTGYAEVEDEVAFRGYSEAMRRVDESAKQTPKPSSSFAKYVGCDNGGLRK